MVVLVVLVALVALAACGGSAKKVDPAADLALAKSAVLTAADVPGYAGSPHTPSDDIPAAAKKEFAACMKAPTTIFDDAPGAQKADSPDFAKSQAQVSNSIEIDPKKSDVEKGWSQISKTEAAACLQKLFQSVITSGANNAQGVTFGPTSVARFDVGIGNRSVGYALKFSASGAGGKSAVFYADLVFLARDRAGLEFDFLDVDTPLNRSFETSLAQTVYDRVGTKAK
jgi:hypothetical protein